VNRDNEFLFRDRLARNQAMFRETRDEERDRELRILLILLLMTMTVRSVLLLLSNNTNADSLVIKDSQVFLTRSILVHVLVYRYRIQDYKRRKAYLSNRAISDGHSPIRSISPMQPSICSVGNEFGDGLTSPCVSVPVAADTIDEPGRACSNHQQLTFPAILPLHSDPAEVDSRDVVSFSLPLGAHPMTRVPPADGHGRPRLTLSAFRRHAIRLTKTDPERRLIAEYDLNALGCRGVLGHGAFSTVRLAIRKSDGAKVAIKTIAKHEALRSRRLRVGGRRYLEEWEILRRFQNHPYIIGLLDVFETDEEIQLVLEYCEGGELFAAIQKRRNRTLETRRYTEAETAQITSQILCALSDLHSAGIVHRDVKAENVLLVNDKDDDVHVKLCDFGLARPLFDQESSCDSESSDDEGSPSSAVVTPGRLQRSFSIVGSNYYAAPEVRFSERFSPASDVYSLGVTLYILLCGFPPVFAGDDELEVMFPSTYWVDVSPEAKTLVEKMLRSTPLSRITSKEALSDPWIMKYAQASWFQRTANLDLVCRRLYSSVSVEAASIGKKRPFSAVGSVQSPQRTRMRSSSVVIALADLCRGISSVPSDASEHHFLTATSLAIQPSLSAGHEEPETESPASCFAASTTVAAL
jgi:calcium-dependent protein kinase